MLEMLERHGSWTGTVFASSPSLTVFRSGALPVKGLELVVGKRQMCGDLSPESTSAILPKTPPDAVWTHDHAQTVTYIFGSSAGANFPERPLYLGNGVIVVPPCWFGQVHCPARALLGRPPQKGSGAEFVASLGP